MGDTGGHRAHGGPLAPPPTWRNLFCVEVVESVVQWKPGSSNMRWSRSRKSSSKTIETQPVLSHLNGSFPVDLRAFLSASSCLTLFGLFFLLTWKDWVHFAHLLTWLFKARWWWNLVRIYEILTNWQKIFWWHYRHVDGMTSSNCDS